MTSPPPRLGDRTLFPDLRPRAYLNHAAVSPPSLPVRAAVAEVVDAYATVGAAAWPRFRDQRELLRGRLAALIGAGAADIALTSNTSHGVIAVAMCRPWQAGERLLLLRGEFPANVTPWQRAADLFDLEIVWLDAARVDGSDPAGMAELEAVLAGGVRLLAVSAVQFQTGTRMPLAALAAACHRHGAELFVDGIQAAGIVPLDVAAAGVDYLCAGSHKWLMGIEGAGFLYAAPRCAAALQPRLASWLSHEDPVRFLFEGAGHLRTDRPIRGRIDFLEGGVMASASFAALYAATGLLGQLGVATIHAHVQSLLDPLEAALRARGFHSARRADPAGRSGILAVRPPAGVDLVDLWRRLDERGVSCATPDGYLRFSPHWYNSRAEIDAAIAAVDEVLRR